MLKIVRRISAILVILHGMGHTLGTAYFYSTVTQEVIWFAGTGIGEMILGLLNLVPAENLSGRLKIATAVVNIVWLILMLGLLTTSQSIQVIGAVFFTLGLCAGSIGSIRKTTSSS